MTSCIEPETKELLPGLPLEFNHYLALLDRMIPQMTRKNEGIADILFAVANNDTEIAPYLNSLIADLDGFRRLQFYRDTSKDLTDLCNTWLPLVLLGKNWNKAIECLLSFSLPQELERVRLITLQATAQKYPAKFEVELMDNIVGVDINRNEIFERHIKRPFDLRSSYDVDAEIISVRGKKRIDSDELLGEGESLLAGTVPQWLSYLLEWNAVSALHVSYPIREIEVGTLCDSITRVLVLPSCPAAWRKDPGNLESALKEMRNHLRSDELFHMVLTSIGDEWYGIINQFLLEISAGASQLFTGGKLGSNFVQIAMARYLSLPPSATIRRESGYLRLQEMFCTPAVDSEGQLTPASCLTTETDESLYLHISQAIGCCEYLDKAVTQLEAAGVQVLENIRNAQMPDATTSSDAKSKPLFGLGAGADEKVAEIRRTGIKTWRELCLAVIEMIVRNLGAIREIVALTKSRQDRVIHRQRNWLHSEDTSSLPEAAMAFRFLLKTLIEEKDRRVREKALTAVLYFFDQDDAVPDTDAFGNCDDEIAIAKVLRDLGASCSIPEDIGKWALASHANADKFLDANTQSRIYSRLEEYHDLLTKG